MSQSTLDAFVRKPVPAPAPAPTNDGRMLDAMPIAMRAAALAMEPESEKARGAAMAAEPKDLPRLRVAGTSTVLGTVEEAREHVGEDGVIFLVTLSWRHRDHCGADRVIAATELRGASFDRRPPPKSKKGEPKELPSTLSPDELIGLVDVGEEVAEMLVSDERAHVVVMDGYPKGESYARLAAGIAARCIKLRRAGKDVVLPRATAPADATCKAVLAAFKKCRSVEAMRKVAIDYYDEHLADRFP